MFFKLAFLFIAVPFLEIVILIKLGTEIGLVDTLLIVVVTGVAGAALARWQGVRVWTSIAQRLQQGEMPADEMIDGLLIFAAGVVLLTPGLLTDAFGFLLLIPTTRSVFKQWLRRKFAAMSANRDGNMMIILK